jgi:hypothetical protein
MRLSRPLNGYQHFQANDPLRPDEVVLFVEPRAGWVHWELGEQGPQLPPDYPLGNLRGGAGRKR